MSSPAETSTPQPTPASAHTGFDPIEFWMLHQKKIIGLAVLFIVGLIGYTIFTINENRTRAAAEAAYASANTADEFRKVAQDYSGQPAAANAQLQLAALLRKDGKLDETEWIDRKLHIAVKSVRTDGSGFEFQNIKEGLLPASTFDLPAGYQKFDMGNMMRGMGKDQ